MVKRIKEEKSVIIQGDGTSLWTLTFNTDFAVGFVGLMGNPHAVGEAFQITSDETLTWNQIYEEIAKALGVPLHPYHVASDFLSASGRLCRTASETTKRLEFDAYAKFKYDKYQDADAGIIERVRELAENKNVSMTEVSLAWLLSKVDAPIMGVTKKSNIDGAVKAMELELTQADMVYLEELYVPHTLSGVMAQNGKQKAGDVV